MSRCIEIVGGKVGVGDTVQMKSGGPPMTVVGFFTHRGMNLEYDQDHFDMLIQNNGVYVGCEWVDSSGQPHARSFLSSTLQTA
jgi:uncharacterized protein YodC (DUF2158 family)